MATALGNAAEIRIALRRYATDLNQELIAEWGTILKPVVAQARSFAPDIPMRNWESTKGRKLPLLHLCFVWLVFLCITSRK